MFRSTLIQCRRKSPGLSVKKVVLALVLLGVMSSTGDIDTISRLIQRNVSSMQKPVVADINITGASNAVESSRNMAVTKRVPITASLTDKTDSINSSTANSPVITAGNQAYGMSTSANMTGYDQSNNLKINDHAESSHHAKVVEPNHTNVTGDSLLLAVNINGVEVDGVFTLLKKSNGDLMVAEKDLLGWRINTSSYNKSLIEGKPYVRIDDLSGVKYYVDAGTQTLMLQLPASAFIANEFDGDVKSPLDLYTTQAGGFLNYDLNWQRIHRQETAGGLFEIGAFNSSGNGTNTAIWRSGDAQRGMVRLDTTWNIDMPGKMQSLRFGDAISRGSSWGRSVRFGGVQWGTNFATRPDFTTFPMPTLRGEAVLPSTIDLYVNNTRRLQSNVESGPFDLANVPVVTGQGELQLVVRDLLGRQQIITQPYYASQSLLRPGLHDFSIEAGAIRNNYGIDSANYGHLMLGATDRLGLSPTFTRELRAEVLSDQQTLGANGVWLMPQVGTSYLGTLNFGAAVSNHSGKDGHFVALGTERQTRKISYSLQSRYADRDFAQIGQLANSTPRNTFTASVGLPLAGNSLGLNYLSQSTWEGAKNRMLSLNLSRGLGSFGNLSLSALRNFTNEPHNSVSLILTIPLDSRTSMSFDAIRQGDLARNAVLVQRNPPPGSGLGYRVRASDSDEYLASATVNTNFASFNAETAQANGQEGYRVGASGGIAVAGGGMFLSRRIDDSFAVVRVDDYANVRVYRENQEVTRTDQNGRALIPHLRGYQKNLVSIAQEDLPLDAEVDKLELRLTPALRSAVVLDFPVRRSRSVSFRLVGEDGKTPAPGTMVQLEADKREFPIGFDGRVFISGLNINNRLFSVWSGRRCSLEINLGDTKELLPDLGTLICKGVPQ